MDSSTVYIVSANDSWRNMVKLALSSTFKKFQFETRIDVHSLWQLLPKSVVIFDKNSLGSPIASLINPRDRGGQWLIVNAEPLDEESVPGLIALGFCGLIIEKQTIEMMPRAIRTLRSNELWFSRRAMSLSLKQNFNLAPQPATTIHTLSAKYNLSTREQQVFLFLLQGQTNKEIASAMYLSPSTIKCHVASILLKTGKQGRNQISSLLLDDTLESVL